MCSSAGLPGFADKAARERLPLKARSIMASAKRPQTIRLKRAEWRPLEANGFKRPANGILDRPSPIPIHKEKRPTFRLRLSSFESQTESGSANVAAESVLPQIEVPEAIFAHRSLLDAIRTALRPVRS